MLVEKGANVHAASDENATALIFAATDGKISKKYIQLHQVHTKIGLYSASDLNRRLKFQMIFNDFDTASTV